MSVIESKTLNILSPKNITLKQLAKKLINSNIDDEDKLLNPKVKVEELT